MMYEMLQKNKNIVFKIFEITPLENTSMTDPIRIEVISISNDIALKVRIVGWEITISKTKQKSMIFYFIMVSS